MTYIFCQMKIRLRSICFFFLLAPLFTSAQVLIGPVFGPQVTWQGFKNVDRTNSYKQHPVFGFHAGADISFRVQKRFFLNASVLYSTKGKSLTGTNPDVVNKEKFNFIDVPISYTVEFISKAGRGKEFKWYFGAGPHVSYWLNGKGSISTTELSEVNIDRIDYKIVYGKDTPAANEMNVDQPNRLQLGLNISAGLVFQPFGYQKVLVMMRYELGHSYYGKGVAGTLPQVTDYVDSFRYTTQGFRLSFAYLIDLKTDQRKKGKSTSKIRRGRG